MCTAINCARQDADQDTGVNVSQDNNTNIHSNDQSTGEPHSSLESPKSPGEEPWGAESGSDGINKPNFIVPFISGIWRVITFALLAFFSWLFSYSCFRNSLHKGKHTREAYWYWTGILLLLIWVSAFLIFGDTFTHGEVTSNNFFRKIPEVFIIFILGLFVFGFIIINSRKKQ
ncbi:MAG TPA: hypothetical protein DCO75_12295 [Fibrobacteres bacterium]|nr:hypothetical protein [Fibrobacterota bacterium]